MKKPLILITNDDGIKAKGLQALIDVMKNIGKVVVVASEESMSGKGHSITIRTPLRIKSVITENGYEKYSTNGTPVDCVKLGEQVILKQKPDLLVSGINHGSNATVNIIYSGTMAAVLEACIDEIPAIGFSLLDYTSDADFEPSKKHIKTITENVLKNGLPKGVCLNVNIPAVKESEIKGVKVCRQADARWVEVFDERKDPHNNNYYWLTGRFEKRESNNETDQWALENNYISLVPVHYDFTAHKALPEITKWKFDVK